MFLPYWVFFPILGGKCDCHEYWQSDLAEWVNTMLSGSNTETHPAVPQLSPIPAVLHLGSAMYHNKQKVAPQWPCTWPCTQVALGQYALGERRAPHITLKSLLPRAELEMLQKLVAWGDRQQRYCHWAGDGLQERTETQYNTATNKNYPGHGRRSLPCQTILPNLCTDSYVTDSPHILYCHIPSSLASWGAQHTAIHP